MRGKNIIRRATCHRAMLLCAATALAVPVHAQETWTLQPSSPTPTPSPPAAQGPVDAQAPVVPPTAETRPSPAPSSETPVLAPVPKIGAPKIDAPPPVDAERAQPRRSAEPPVPPSTAPTASPAPVPAEPASTPQPIPTPPPVSQPAPTEPAPVAQSESGTGISWWWALVPLAAAGIGAVLWRRRRQRPETVEDEAPADAVFVETPPEPQTPPPSPPPPPPRREPVTPTPTFGAAVEPAPAPPPPPIAAPAAVEVEFEPLGLRISLYYATLQYRITLRSAGERAAGHLAIDMISAHGSLDRQVQLAPPFEALGQPRAVPAMQAGQAVTLTGELQVTLNDVRALRQGNATYLVPLVRLYLLAEGQVPLRRVFTVGAVGAGPALAPLRLDTGPRMASGLAAREVELARDLPFDPEPFRAAG